MPKRRALRRLARLISALIGLALLFEIGVRLFWTTLPNELRLAVVGVRILPWSEETLVLPAAKLKVQDAKAPADNLDVLALGDSFTFCWMDASDCWIAHLSAYGWRALSAAALGSGSTEQLDMLRKLLPSLKPRLIIWQWYHNDAEDNCRLARRGAAAQTTAESEPERPPVFGSGLGRYSALARMIGNWLRGRASTPQQPSLAPAPEPPCEGDMTSVLDDYAAGIALAAEHGATVVIALMPHIDEVEDAQSPHEAVTQARQTVRDRCTARGYHCVDPFEVFRAAYQSGQRIYGRADLHLTPEGRRLFAETLIAYIEQHGLLPKKTAADAN
ncbi:MAG: SGNH/GDSL hydrolase family protein [Chloroflexi bacterium]|nr:SGNH/GDSL hydrolase family protein [Chloroflexota bacterium]